MFMLSNVRQPDCHLRRSNLARVYPNTGMSEIMRKVSVEEVEREYLVEIASEDGARIARPFGYCHQQWLDLLSKKQDGDELWISKSHPEAWMNLAGAEGIVLMRNGQAVDSIILGIS